MTGLLGYALVLLAISLAMPTELFNQQSAHFLLAIGVIASWRYIWAATHLVRSLIYSHIVFPRLRREADGMGVAGMPTHAYLLVTSFRIDTETSTDVYRAAIEEAARTEIPVTIVASLVEMADQRLVKQLFLALNPPEHVRLSFIRIGGTGKRDALAQGLRTIQMLLPPPGSVVVVVDGDTVLEPYCLKRSLPFFKVMPDISAFTTDEVCEVRGARVFHDWYNMRFAQRQILMCSMGLSRRVLTLTGRMSAFRIEVATDPTFIQQLESDSVDHWRLGRFSFLTGDDKSTWYWILRHGGKMAYIPDVTVSTVESPPDNDFIRSSTMLMVRWFGNMLRTNSRALALGPRKIGLFVWWTVLDQRVSMWTAIVGPTAAILLTLYYGPMALLIYAYWIAVTRFIQTLALLTARKEVSWTFPFLLFFNQVYGSIVKTYIFFRLDRQKWTRQNTTSSRNLGSLHSRVINMTSWSMHAVALLLFLAGVGTYLGILKPFSFLPLI
ncbi:glycosyltransferase [Asticcacaulis sp. AC402]|uniref:glycosyltransferase n=1 Tax=Asticcacaulis sp. AC402 TaxID=1282361 RepID=UPI0004CDDC7A|nr:glycosyltransferase [Asticcacaulis sp. AC402]